MTEYYSAKSNQIETVISRSRFITHIYQIKSEDEAAEILKALGKKYSDATHICYGYVADILGNVARFSDDGEPSGTAGRPILDATIKSGLKQVLVAVVRYFGGVKLGAGGLTRAYSNCAAEIIDKTEKIKYVKSDVFLVRLDFNAAEKFKKFLLPHGKILDTEYSDFVDITAAVPTNIDITGQLDEITGGKTDIKLLKTDYIIF